MRGQIERLGEAKLGGRGRPCSLKPSERLCGRPHWEAALGGRIARPCGRPWEAMWEAVLPEAK